MKKLLSTVLSLLVISGVAMAAQNANSSTTNQTTETKTGKKRGPVFRANKEQIKRAQALLKEKGLYPGDQTGKLTDETRAGLRKYQEAENLKVTGTLNKLTLVKMGIELTDKQKLM